MKIRDIIGEGAAMVVKDFKPGQSLSMVDPTTDTMTIVDLKKNPTALQTGPDGKFTYDPTPDAAAPGEPKQPELKPGAQIQVDTATTEQSEDNFEAPPMPNIDGLEAGESKPLPDGEKVTLKQDGTVEYDGSFGKYVYDSTGTAINYVSPNFAGLSKSKDFKTGKTTQNYTAGPLSVKQSSDGSKEAEYQLGPEKLKMSQPGAEGYAPGTALDVKNERMDESAIITALARRIAGTEVTAKTKSKEVFDLKKLAGL